MRRESTERTASTMSEPPKPRLMIFKSGKYDAVSHRRIVELPTKTMPPLWGGDILSAASKAAMSFSHRSAVCAATEEAESRAKTTKTAGRMRERLTSTKPCLRPDTGADAWLVDAPFSCGALRPPGDRYAGHYKLEVGTRGGI